MRRSSLLLILAVLLVACGKPPEPTRSLYNAVDVGDLDQVKRHVFYQSDLNVAAASGETAIHVASRKGRWAIARLLLQNGADPGRLTAEGKTALQLALLNRNVELAELLVRQGSVDADMQALMREVIQANLDDKHVIEFLLRHGGSLEIAFSNGNLPLHEAAVMGDRRMLRLLIHKGADPNAYNQSGKRPLNLAADSGSDDAVRYLQSIGALP